MMFNMIFYGALAASVIAGLGFVAAGVYSSGYAKCQLEHVSVALKEQEETARKITQIRNQFDKKVEKVYEAPESDNGPVAPVLERTLDGLRERHGQDAK